MIQKLADDTVLDRKAAAQKRDQLKNRLFKVIGHCDSFHTKICRLLEENRELEESMKRGSKVNIINRKIDMPAELALDDSNVRLDAKTEYIPLDENESNVQEEKDFQKMAKKSLKKISELYKFEIDELAKQHSTIEVMKQGAGKILQEPLLISVKSPSHANMEKEKEEHFKINFQEAKQKAEEFVTDMSQMLKQYQVKKQMEDEF